MAAVREIKIGGIAGEIANYANVHLIQGTRKRTIEDIRTYNHKQPEADTVPFLDVYSEDRELANKSADCLGSLNAIYPENVLQYAIPEQIFVTEEYRTKSRHFAKGLVLLRTESEQVIRLWVEIDKKYAENGNHYHTDRSCWPVSEEEYLKVFNDTLKDPDPGSKADS